MNKNAYKRRIVLVPLELLVCIVSGLVIGHFGLEGHNQFLTWFSACLFAFGTLVFFLAMIYPFKWDQFWYSYVLKRMGRIGWGRRFGISEYAEGAIVLAFLQVIWDAYLQIIVGGESYVSNNLTTIALLMFANSWLSYSAHSLFQKLRGLGEVSGIISSDQRTVFKQKIEMAVTWFNKYSIVLMFLGGLVFEAVSIFWVDWQDRVMDKLVFYVTTPYTQSSRFAIVYPMTTVPYFMGKLSGGLIFGFLAIIGGLVLVTTIFFLWLTSSEIKPIINIYDPECLKPVEEMLNSFWLMTGSGLLLVPFATGLSFNFLASGQSSASSWENYIGGTYIVFFVGFFFFSLIKFYSFVSLAKKPVEKEIREEIRRALEPKTNRSRLAAARTKMQLLQSFKNRPTMTTIVQLAEIVSIILLNFVIRLLG
jgi:hypothetical protein